MRAGLTSASPGLVRWLAPVAAGLLAAFIDLLPLTAVGTPAPMLTLAVLHAWTLHDPESVSPATAFLIGLVLDAVGGMPLGLTSLAFLLVRAALSSGQRLLTAQPFAVVWASFAVTVLVFAALRWLLASLWWMQLYPVQPALAEALLTFAIYPLVGWPVGRLHQALMPRRHAAGS
jgi:rod shape-determining protein MreD